MLGHLHQEAVQGHQARQLIAAILAGFVNTQVPSRTIAAAPF